MDKNKVTVFEGLGSFESATKIKISKKDGSSESIESKYTIIATGSKPSSLPFITLDKERIITSTEALNLKEIPKKFLVIGGGVIGLELGSVFLRLGSEVTVIEFMDKIIPGMDGALSKELKRRGWTFFGPTTAYAFMQAVGLVNDHLHGRIALPKLAQKAGAVRRRQARAFLVFERVHHRERLGAAERLD